MNKEIKIAFIGKQGSIEFFGIFGAEMFSVSDQQQAYEIIEKLDFADYGGVFISEEVFDSDRFHRYIMEKKLVVVPSLESKEGKGYQIVDELIKKATGMKG